MNTGDWGAFVKGVSAKINEIIDETKDLNPQFMSLPIFKKKDTDQLTYRTHGVTGFGYLEAFDEDDGIKADKTYPAYKTEYTSKQLGKTVPISQLLAATRDGSLEEKLDEIRQLRIAAAETSEKWFWQNFVDAFTTTDSVSDFPISRLDDGVPWISANHPSKVPGVGSRSNLIVSSGVTNPAYNETAQFDAIKMLREMKNGRGKPINYKGKFLVLVPPALEKLAIEINKSTKRSGTGNNDLNYFEGIVDVVSSVYIGAANGGSDTAWFVLAMGAENSTSLRYVRLIETKIEKQQDFFTKTMNVSVDQAECFGYSNFEYIVGSTGLLS